jgi:uncharacterized protein YbgA (DUF1722 family)/uncharacterized protein YbbK (DUF523 family)
VRYDGGHKRDRFVSDVLGGFVEWVAVCPELEAGLGLPRPPMRLVRDGDDVRMVEIESRRDHSRTLTRFSTRRVRALRALDLCGYVLKRGSPSCGMTRVRVFREKGAPERRGVGLFAKALLELLPELPVEEEGRLNDPGLRENFIERVFAYRRLGELLSGRFSSGQVVAFHTAHKLQLMAHSPEAYRALGRQVAEMKRIPRAQFRDRYRREFMAALARVASRARNTNVLHHAAGHLKKRIGGPARAELAQLIDDYREGLVPLVVPITLLRHHTREHDIPSLQGQTFLSPHPKELMLRNHV